MTYRHWTLIGAAALLALATTVTVAQQEIRIVQDVATTLGPGIGGPGGPLAPMAMGTGLIFGQAVDAGSGRPVPGALVTLNLSGVTPIRALADSQGRFAFRDLPKGRFNLTVTKAGYVDGAYGRMRPSGPTLSLDLAENERVSGVSIPVWKYAAVAGIVVDEQGDPIVNAAVRVLKRGVAGGQWRLTPGPQDSTDDRGAYRIGMLEPGEYVVAVPMSQNAPFLELPLGAGGGGGNVMTFVSAACVSAAAGSAAGAPIIIEGPNAPNAGMSEDGHPLAYPTQFFPTAASASRAAIVTVGSGEERTSVDFQLKPARTVKIAGVAMGPEGPVGGLQLTLAPAEASELITAVETMSSFSGEGGTFTFPAVPAGQYTLRASRTPRIAFSGPGETTTVMQGGAVMVTRTVTNTSGAPPPLPTEPTLWAEMNLAVATNDVTDLTVSMRAGLRVTGGVQFDGAAARPSAEQLPAIAVTLESADVRPGSPSTVRGRVEPSGTFATMGVPPGRYFVRVAGAPQGWTFRGATLGGRDVTDAAFEIDGDVTGVMLSFTDRQTELSGTVTSDAGPPEAATVIAFPTDSSAWVGYGSMSRRLRTARVDKTANYSISNLPAGEYFVVAVPDRVAADWQNPKFLEGLTNDATRVRIVEGDKRSQNVKVAR